jgi:TPR repeat protein
LGDADAHYNSIMYLHGQGVEKEKKKKVYHLEEAADTISEKAGRDL